MIKINKNTIIEDILYENGIYDTEKFLNIDSSVLENYELYDNMYEGYDTYIKNINDKIGLLVDCDCDGYTSASIIYQHILSVNERADITLFFHEGKQHGLEEKKVFNDIINSGIKLLITPDASSNDFDKHKELSSLGIDILVLDHHECEKYSENAIVINNQLSSGVKNKALSGVGVVYKFIQYVDNMSGVDRHSKYIDLVALGNCGDMMDSLSYETRCFMIEGFKEENINNKFLKSMISKYIDGNVTMSTIAWNVVPKINALIRCGTQEEKDNLFKAFITPTKRVDYCKSKKEGNKKIALSTMVIDIMDKAKRKQDSEVKKGVELLSTKIDNSKKAIVVQLDNELNKSYTGLVANKLAGTLNKPVLLLQESSDKGFYTGSARCPNGYGGIESFKDFTFSSNLFEFCEGHSNAYGVKIKGDKVDEFSNWIENELNHTDNESTSSYDFKINSDELEEDLIKAVADYDWLWGQNLKEPKFLIKNVVINSSEIVMPYITLLVFNHNWIRYEKKFCSKVFRESLHFGEDDNVTLKADVIGTFIKEDYKGETYYKVAISEVIIK